jgi:hypothetical protein
MLVTLAFLLLTAGAVSQTLMEWQEHRKNPTGGMVYLELYGGLSVFLAILCLYSFVKARNVR